MKAIRIVVTGRVCKVGYRYFVKQMADRCEISGSVRYSGNRSVEIIASGSESQLEKFITYCKIGCPGSKILRFHVTELPGYQFAKDFSMKITDESN
jgi:acylphosphatase